MGLIYLDSCLLIYLVENHQSFATPVIKMIAAEAPESLAISPLVKLECMVKPIKLADPVLEKRYEQAFAELTSLPMTDEVFLQAAQLRARFGLKAPDALHLACAQVHACTSLWTNDDRLLMAGRGLTRNLLKLA